MIDSDVARAFGITNDDFAALSENDQERLRLFLTRPSFKPIAEQGAWLRRMIERWQAEGQSPFLGEDDGA